MKVKALPLIFFAVGLFAATSQAEESTRGISSPRRDLGAQSYSAALKSLRERNLQSYQLQLQQAADAGNLPAMNRLAQMHLDGNGGFPKDRAKAIELFKRSFAAGSPFGYVNLLSIRNSMREEDPNAVTEIDESDDLSAKAFQLAAQLANKGDSESALALGLLYGDGIGVAPSHSSWLKWIRTAAEQGNQDAQIQLARYLTKRVEDFSGGSEYQPAEGLKWLERAASAGEGAAMFNIALLYEHGQPAVLDVSEGRQRTIAGIDRDMPKALHWYERAAASGNSSSMYNLGMFFAAGRGVPKDASRAAQYWKLAAMAKNTSALFNLGILYRDGDGVEKDLQQTRNLWEQAAALGHQRSKEALAKLESTGK